MVYASLYLRFISGKINSLTFFSVKGDKITWSKPTDFAYLTTSGLASAVQAIMRGFTLNIPLNYLLNS